ncbi:MAG: ATP-binding protein [Verrucomicrobia bacterium]|nr:ATP-binding protein [Verrucomicrobiota bacterium]
MTGMNLVIASGKGGTGKTTVATSLAVTLARHGQTVAYVDCDVETPNGHLFLKPMVTRERPVEKLVPRVNQETCLLCGLCAAVCRFNAIACLPDQTLVYEELCHGCGGCTRVCPVGAITEAPHPVGVVKVGAAGAIQFVSGTLNVGESTSPPVIRATRQAAPAADWTILDAPPGTACPMMEAVRGSDYVVLVTEPTPFGLHDLRLALEVVKTFDLPCGVVVNRAQPGATEARDLCRQARVRILAEIPDAVAIAKEYSRGQLVVETVPGLREIFDQLCLRLLEEVPKEKCPHEMRQRLEAAIRASSQSPATGPPAAGDPFSTPRLAAPRQREEPTRAASAS